MPAGSPDSYAAPSISELKPGAARVYILKQTISIAHRFAMSAAQYYQNSGGAYPPQADNRGYGGGYQQGYGGGGPPPQQYGYQQQQPVYVQGQQAERGGGGDMCCGICLGCCALFACEEICGALVGGV